MDNALVGLVRLKDRRIVWCNDAFARMLGYTPQELTGRSKRILHPTDASFDAFCAGVDPGIARGETVLTEVLRVRKDGSPHWYDVSIGTFAPDGDERICTYIDVTSRHEAEAALAAKAENLRCITTSMAEGVVLQAKDGRILDANPAAETILGLTREQLLGMTSLDPGWQTCRADGTPYPGAEHPAMLCLRTGEPQRGEIMGVRAPNRGLRWISINAQPVLGSDAREPVAAVTTFVDVTEERRLTLELKEARTDLQAILDNMPARITAWNADFTNRFANRTAAAQFGMDAASCVGRPAKEIIGAARYAKSLPFIKAALKGAQKSHEQHDEMPDGSVRYSRVQYVPRRQDGRIVGIFALGSDITELHDSYERIRDLAQRVESVREDERRCLSRTLHEGIAQDLFAIKLGLANLSAQAKGRAGVTALYEEMSAVLAKCMGDTRRLANDLWPSALATSTVAIAIENHARYFSELSGLAIQVTEVAPFPALDEATRLLFFRAAQEALTNVARHAEATAVQIELRADAHAIHLDVIDDGVGIGDGVLKKAGSLGLLGIRERFAAGGGGLEVCRHEPHGTIMSVHLPIPTAAAI
jgi:PAS domain S-box-containing protein